MSWEDKILYWEWRVDGLQRTKPPTVKRLEYAYIHYSDWKPNPMTMKICSGVFDDDKYTPLHKEEISWHENAGAKVAFKTD